MFLLLLACSRGTVVVVGDDPSATQPVATPVPTPPPTRVDDTADTDPVRPSDTGAADTGTTMDTGSAPFVETSWTEAWNDTLALRTNVPRLVAACSTVTGAPCEDADADGLADRWETVLLEAMVPLVRFDEAEPLVDDPDAVFVAIARVAPVGDRVRAFITLAYHNDYGRCGLSAHPGDSERVALDLEVLAEGDVGIVGAYTAAHEGTVTDHSTVFVGGDLSELVFETHAGALRWVVFASDGKHATYATVDRCEGASFLPCLEEDCGPDGVPDPTVYEQLPPVFNAGEQATPMLSTLDVVGFPGEHAWEDQQFCGGLQGLICAGSILSKLTVDPFL